MNIPARLIAILFLTQTCLAGPAPADETVTPKSAAGQDKAASFEDGVSALQAGDNARARDVWSACANGGDARCQYGMGYLLQFGLAVPVDAEKAREFYEKAALANNPDALYALGLLYESARLGPRDLARAMDYYKKAAAIGDQADAEYAVGRMILRGRGVPRDPPEALKWLRKAAAHHQPAAEYMIGAAYEAGWGVTPDPTEAYYWYKRAEAEDPVELQEEDMSFDPKIAIESLKHHLSKTEIAEIDARLRREATPAGKADLSKAAKPGKAAAKMAPPVSAPRSDDGLPDALTKQR